MAGRPTKLTLELIEKAKGYLATCEDIIHHTDKGGVSYVDVHLPSLVGLAKYLGIHRDTIYDWCKVNKDTEIEEEIIENALKSNFSDIVKEVEQEQEIRLINKGLGGLYTSKALGAMLSKHGLVEKTETDITTKGEKISSVGVESRAESILNEQGTTETGDNQG